MAIDKNLSPVGQTAVLMIRTYQKLISPLLGQHCRFYPSCSQYTLEAIKEWGLAKGMWLGAKRISRCHPLNEGGIDPVPRRNDVPESAKANLEPKPATLEPKLATLESQPALGQQQALHTLQQALKEQQPALDTTFESQQPESAKDKVK